MIDLQKRMMERVYGNIVTTIATIIVRHDCHSINEERIHHLTPYSEVQEPKWIGGKAVDFPLLSVGSLCEICKVVVLNGQKKSRVEKRMWIWEKGPDTYFYAPLPLFMLGIIWTDNIATSLSSNFYKFDNDIKLKKYRFNKTSVKNHTTQIPNSRISLAMTHYIYERTYFTVLAQSFHSRANLHRANVIEGPKHSIPCFHSTNDNTSHDWFPTKKTRVLQWGISGGWLMLNEKTTMWDYDRQKRRGRRWGGGDGSKYTGKKNGSQNMGSGTKHSNKSQDKMGQDVKVTHKTKSQVTRP
jgi:hypothetical protein